MSDPAAQDGAATVTPTPADSAPEGSADAGAEPAAPVRVSLRRAPRYRSFTLTGAVAGVRAGLVVSLVFGTTDGRFTSRALAGYLAAIGLLIGAVLGAGAGLLAERRRR